MKRLVFIILWAALLAACSPAEANQRQVVDLLDRTVELPEKAESFICIGPGALRLYTYVADPKAIVGIEDMEQEHGGRPYLIAHQADFSELPIIGPGGPANAPDAERLIHSGADIIFTAYNHDARAVDALQAQIGIPVIAISYGDTAMYNEEIEASLNLIGQVTGHRQRAKEVNQQLKSWLEELKEKTSVQTNKPSVYLGAQSHKGSHGIESTMGQSPTLLSIQARNIVDELDITGYVQLDKEVLLQTDPEIIFIDGGGLNNVQADIKSNPKFYQALSAFQNNKTYLILPTNYYSNNIELTFANAYYMASILYPDSFKDKDPVEKFDQITDFFYQKPLYDEVKEVYFGGYQQLELLP